MVHQCHVLVSKLGVLLVTTDCTSVQVHLWVGSVLVSRKAIGSQREGVWCVHIGGTPD